MLGLDPEDPEGTENGAWLPMTTLPGRTSSRDEHECEGTEGMARYSGVEGSRSEVRRARVDRPCQRPTHHQDAREEEGGLDAATSRICARSTGYVRRHQAQRPEGDVRDSRWRYSLMNGAKTRSSPSESVRGRLLPPTNATRCRPGPLRIRGLQPTPLTRRRVARPVRAAPPTDALSRPRKDRGRWCWGLRRQAGEVLRRDEL